MRSIRNFDLASRSIVLVGVLLAGCGGSQRAEIEHASPYRNILVDAAQFTGDAVCASCHEDEWSGFQSHGMANAYYRLTAENLVEDFAAEAIRHPVSGWYYQPIRTDSGFFQVEFRVNAIGERTHQLMRSMDFVVGSGTAARTYISDVEGRLFQLPLTWYTQSESWDFSPGYDVQNKRFDRAIPDRCMACHNAYPESVPFVPGKYADVPEGIGCERCHGPGSIHADERLVDEKAPDSIDYTIVNPTDLQLDRQLDVCQQCHLQTTVSLLRDGKGPFEFRPGLPLREFVSLYYTEPEEEDAETIDVISHSDRMQRSACFVGSLDTSQPMTCTTCHDPHQGFRSVGESYFDAACTSCHPSDALLARFDEGSDARATHEVGTTCSGCHMPKVQASDVTHASFTDHWVRVVRDEGDGESQRRIVPVASHALELHPYFPQDADRGDEQVYRGMAYVVQGKQRADSTSLARGRSLLRRELSSRRGSFAEAWALLGWVEMATGDARAAIDPIEESLRVEPGVPERLNALAQALEAVGGDVVRVESLYREALEVQPAAADIRINFGRFLESNSRLEEALAQYRDAARESPTFATAFYNLGTAHLRQGDNRAARVALEEAVRLKPDYSEALGNLGLLHASVERTEMARDMFEAALEAAPRSAVANANLATYYLGQERAAQAVPLFEAAVALAPEYIQARLNLAVAYFQVNQPGRARAQAEAVLRLEPSNRRAAEIIRALQ